MRGRFAIIFLALSLGVAQAEPRWLTLPLTPPPVAGETTGFEHVDGIDLYYASHFAFLQDPAMFNAALLDFLDGR